MKQLILTIAISMLLTLAHAQYPGIGIQLGYAQSQHDGMDTYFSVLSDSMHLEQDFILKGGFNLGISFINHIDKAEFEIGGGLMRAASYRGDDIANSGITKVRDISLLFGGNYLPVKWWLMGGALAINATEASTEITSSNAFPEPEMASLPTTDLNIFRGYSIGVRGQAGFVFPFEDEEMGSIRFLMFYQYGLTNFDFFKVTDPHLAHYTGSTRSHANILGINAVMVIGFGG